MSLLGAFLNEPYREPREIWFAVRSDGVAGSGTVDDPYDGSVGAEPAFPVTLIKDAGETDGRTVIVTATNHGLAVYDVVTIAGAEETKFNGTFWIFDVSASRFKYRVAPEFVTDLDKTYDTGRPTAARVVDHFDRVMARAPAYALIHLGPGIFETRGFHPAYASQGWGPQPGQQITGSGMGATTLRLMQAVSSGGPRSDATTGLTLAIGHGLYYGPQPRSDTVDGFSVSDLTLDCNLRSQLAERVAKAGVHALGRHVRIRRVRIIDFGTQMPPLLECFPIGIGGGDGNRREPFDSRIEDCLCEAPSRHGVYVSTYMILLGGEDPVSGVMGFNRACAIRHCYANSQFLDRPVSIASIAADGSNARITTRAPHHRKANDWVVISGVLETLSGRTKASRNLNGTFKIQSISMIDDKEFTITPPNTDLGAISGEKYVGRFSGHSVPVQKSEKDTTAGTAVLTTYNNADWFGPHFFKPGDWVYIWNTGVPAGAAGFFGRFQVLEDGLTPTQFKYRWDPANPPSDSLIEALHVTMLPSGEVQTQVTTLYIGPAHQALVVDEGSECVAEGNRIFGATTGGPYQDTWRTKDLMTRDNYYSDVAIGPMESRSLIGTPRPGSSLVVGRIATFTTAYKQPHGLSAGNMVTIQGALLNGSYENPYNGTFEVLADPAPVNTGTKEKQFSYLMPVAPSGDAEGSPVYTTAANDPPVLQGAVVRHPTLARTALLTTEEPQDFICGDEVSVFGAAVNGSVVNPFNGKITVLAAWLTATTFAYELAFDPGVNPSTVVRCAGARAASLKRETEWATLTTQEPHGLSLDIVMGCTVDTPVTIRGALLPYASGNPYSHHFNGTYLLSKDTVSGDRWFSYRLPGAPIPNYAAGPPLSEPQNAGGSPVFFKPEDSSIIKTGSSLIRKAFTDDDAKVGVFTTILPHGLLATPGHKSRVTIRGALVGNSYTNPFNVTDVEISAPVPPVGTAQPDTFEVGLGGTAPAADASGSPVFSTEQETTGLTREGTRARFSMSYPTGLAVGQIIKVSGASFSGISVAAYNGIFRVVEVVDAVIDDVETHYFEYLMDAAPGSAAIDAQFTVFLDLLSITHDGRYLICTTDGPHRLQPGDTVSIWGAEVGGSFDNPYNGAFRVEYLVYDVQGRLVPDQFYIGLNTVPASNPTGSIHWATQNSTPLRACQ